MNKIQKIKINLTNFFCESRLIYATRREDGLYADSTPTEPGLNQVESIVDAFQQKYDPENLNYAEHNVNEVVTGVRGRMMEGPFNDLTVLSGGRILDERVKNKLSDIADQAPQKYQQIINEEVRRSGRLLERRNIAHELLTYENIAGANYLTFVRNLEHELLRFGTIGAAAFRDSRGNPINLANPAASNEFDVAVGNNTPATTTATPPVNPRETVTIHWHNEDFASIQEKLKRAGMWANFSRQGSVREFIHLHFRLSLVKQAIAEEKAKLSVDRFSPQMLKIWLDNERTTRALSTLSTATPSANDIEAARKRVSNQSVMGRLEKILLPNTLEDMSDSMETRTMLAYLRHKLDDVEDRKDIDALLNSLSGTKDQKALDAAEQEIETANKNIDQNTSVITNLGKLDNFNVAIFAKFDGLTRTQERLANEQTTAHGKRLTAINQELAKIDENLETESYKLVDQLKRVQLQLQKLNGTTVNEINSFVNVALASSSQSDLDTFIGNIKNIMIKNEFAKDLESLIETKKQDAEKEIAAANQVKTENNQKINDLNQASPNVKKMDSRGLLYKLVEHDLKKQGVSISVDLERQALIGTNALINVCRNSAVYGDVNQSIARELKNNPSRLGRGENWLQKQPFFSSVLTGQDAIEHLVDTDPELKMFKEIQVTSTKADLLKMMYRHGGDCSPTKLRELAGKIGEIIRGFAINENDKRIDNKDISKLERLIHTLGLLEAQLTTEKFIKEVQVQASIDPANRGNIILDMLQEQTESSQITDEGVKNLVEDHESEFKKLYTRKELSQRYNEAMDSLGPKPTQEEITEAFQEYNIDPRAISRGIVSVKSARTLKKVGKAFVKYGPLGWIWYGILSPVGSKLESTYSSAKDVFIEAKEKFHEFSTWGYIKNRWNDETDPATTAKVKAWYVTAPAALSEPIKWVGGAGGYIISRPNRWLKSITNYFSPKSK
ncbi:hypothetical protein KKD70_02560 [Patescibacteria group bacterium]|nr:hypothetical protein [Patescibacteria group bacterium]